MHKLLARQLRRYCGGPEHAPEEMRPLLAAVEEAYRQSDDDRAMLERSMEIVSEELAERSRLRLLTVILAECDLSLASPELITDQRRQSFVEIRHTAERAAALTRQLLMPCPTGARS